VMFRIWAKVRVWLGFSVRAKVRAIVRNTVRLRFR
jgi:hypothetical protein